MFKKKLITSAITASLMMGIASTSFAATLPKIYKNIEICLFPSS